LRRVPVAMGWDMPRYILRFRGNGSSPQDDVERLKADPEIRILDTASSRMLLVEAAEEPLRKAIGGMPDWVMSEEHDIPLPDPRQRLSKPPEDKKSS
jgi:hypothetical protein